MKYSRINATLRNESNEYNYSVICYSNHSLIMRSNASLDLSRDFTYVVEVTLETDFI
jgi:hypothetical protein